MDCAVCGLQEQDGGMLENDSFWQKCVNCGDYKGSSTAWTMLKEFSVTERANLSFDIWRKSSGGESLYLNSENIKAICDQPLPNPATQVDRLILFLGDDLSGRPGKSVKLPDSHLRAKIGAANVEDIRFVREEAETAGLLRPRGDSSVAEKSLLLTLKGWNFYEELQHGAAHGNIAFMAMPFGNSDVRRMVDNVFRKAVGDTGFVLKRVDDDPKAGLIDNKLRVDIRLARFVIADLTDKNLGAYWEAGYAEGLGKPVIYTCEAGFFNDKNKGTHFDTNHHQTVLWELENPDGAAAALKATIRATLPSEARMPRE